MLHRSRPLALVLAGCLFALTAGQPAHAGAVTVDSVTKVVDGDTSSIDSLIADPGADGVISLGEAIEASNNTPGPDTIAFDIPGCPDVCIIEVTNGLPPLTGDGTTIDGYTQPGASPATAQAPAVIKIELRRIGYIGGSGITISSANNVIRGLAVGNWADSAIHLVGAAAHDNVISGNYAGTDASGSTAVHNFWGISIDGAPDNTVGGDSPADRNLFSGNTNHGILICGDGATGNHIAGNYVGLDASGALDLGNGFSGLYIGTNASGNTVGGSLAGQRNVISGNNAYGLVIGGSGADSNRVIGNYIGTDASGTGAVGNGTGMRISYGAQNNTVGGLLPGERNIISGNWSIGAVIQDDGTTGNVLLGNAIGPDANGAGGIPNTVGIDIFAGAQNNVVGPYNVVAYHGLFHGIMVDGGNTTGNAITRTSFFGNDMGIHLNDGANGGVASPEITAVSADPIRIQGTACAGCTVEVFASQNDDGEGEHFVGAATAHGDGTFSLTLPCLGRRYVTATATDPTLGTSEFSAPFETTVPLGCFVWMPLISRE